MCLYDLAHIILSSMHINNADEDVKNIVNFAVKYCHYRILFQRGGSNAFFENFYIRIFLTQPQAKYTLFSLLCNFLSCVYACSSQTFYIRMYICMIKIYKAIIHYPIYNKKTVVNTGFKDFSFLVQIRGTIYTDFYI